MPRLATVFGLLLVSLFQGTAADTWCGKNFRAGAPVVPPGGEFPTPASSSKPLLAFSCSPAIKPYLPADASTTQTFMIDAPVVYSHIAGTAPITLPKRGAPSPLEVTVSVGGKTLATGSLAPNSSTTLSFSLTDLSPQTALYDVQCTARYGSTANYTAAAQLAYLPDPPAGRSVTKMDLRTGALLAQPANGKGGAYETVFPVGYYTSFDWLAANLSTIDEVAAQGYTVIHPVPPFSNMTALTAVVERMEKVGIYLMYDMRYTYQNSTSVTEQVNSIKNSPALLLWYTGDEPDGTSDPLNATVAAYDLINSLDGYHPVSLVLNCDDYHWADYAAGADIVMQDAYTVGTNTTWSVVWDAPCTPDFGDCGCDDCIGALADISARMDEFAARRVASGWARTKALWTVPQGFGDELYWSRAPTGAEFVVEAVLGINHGARGAVSWTAPAPADITASGAALSRALAASMKQFLLSPQASFVHVLSNGVDVGMWTVGGETLVLATNMEYAAREFDLGAVPGVAVGVEQVYDGGARLKGAHTIELDSTGSGGFVVGTVG